ncbi:LIC_13387 family protein [Dokdonella sp.]|uniref:LIC_13387 family protein n=1 Tax=Dokdonella sp. TaxID=2291710 RepID=UPI003C5ACCDD
MISEILMVSSAAIILLLGSMHLVFTFFGSRMQPRDPGLRARMDAVSPVISRDTTMWRAWIGFNASHSLGAMLFGMVYGYLAFCHAELLFGSSFLLAVGFAMLVAFLLLARTFWFRIPLAGISVALACYAGSILIQRF